MDVRKKQREHERMAVAAGDDDEEEDDDIEDFLAKVKSKHRANHDEDDDQYLSSRKGRLSGFGSDDDEYKPSRKKYNFSDEEDISTRRKTHRSLDDLEDEKPRRKTDWRAALISDQDDDNDLSKLDTDKPKSRYLNLSDDDIPSTRRKTKFSGSEDDVRPSKLSHFSSDDDTTKPVTTTRRKYKYDDFSDDDKDEKKSTVKGKGKWSSKFDFSDDEEKSTTKKPIKKDLDTRDEDETYKSRQSHKSYDDNSDDDLPLSGKPKNDTKTTEKKPWELSSDDDIKTSKSTRPSKSTRELLSDEDENTISKPRTRNYLANLSDSDDDLPKLKHAPKKDTTQEKLSPKKSDENEPIRKTSQSSRKSSLDDASKKEVQWDIKEDSTTAEEAIKPVAATQNNNDKSFESSRKRRERRRSRLSNTGTSPENSPKRTSKS